MEITHPFIVTSVSPTLSTSEPLVTSSFYVQTGTPTEEVSRSNTFEENGHCNDRSLAAKPSSDQVLLELATDHRENDPDDRQETLRSSTAKLCIGCYPIIEYDPRHACLPGARQCHMFSEFNDSTACLCVNGYEFSSKLASQIIGEPENNISSMYEAGLAIAVTPSQEYSTDDVLLIGNTVFYKVPFIPNVAINNVLLKCEAQPCENVSSWRTAKLATATIEQ